MIDLRHVFKTFSHDGRGREAFPVLTDISLTVPEGAIVSLIGPTGCGKSTLLEIMAGLRSATHGDVLIRGEKIGARNRAGYRSVLSRLLPPSANALFRDHPRHDIAMIFQDYAVFPWMTACANVAFTLKLAGVPRKERAERASQYLALVGLGKDGDCHPSRMSGGMRQRLALARALAVEPKILLMDEPFAAVDALTREQLRADLLAIQERSGVTVVLVTHDVDEALFLSDRLYLMSPSPGRIVEVIDTPPRQSRRAGSPRLGDLRKMVLMALREAAK